MVRTYRRQCRQRQREQQQRQQVAEICQQAANLLRSRGHVKGKFVDKDGVRICAVAALNVAMGRHPAAPLPKSVRLAVHHQLMMRPDYVAYFAHWLRKRRPDTLVDSLLWRWNDLPATRAEMVIEAFERVGQQLGGGTGGTGGGIEAFGRVGQQLGGGTGGGTGGIEDAQDLDRELQELLEQEPTPVLV